MPDEPPKVDAPKALVPRNEALVPTWERYVTTPREFDPDLARMARGDRGCLPDLIAGLGALSTVGLLVMSVFGWVGSFTILLGVVFWVGGFAYGAVVQGRSAKERRTAIEGGQLVAGTVLWRAPQLESSRVRSGRVILAFSPERPSGVESPPTYEDLAQAAAKFEPSLRRLLNDAEGYGVAALPAGYGWDGLYVAGMIAAPDRTPEREISVGQSILLIVDESRDFAEQAPFRRRGRG